MVAGGLKSPLLIPTDGRAREVDGESVGVGEEKKNGVGRFSADSLPR